jgi:hypothetical protein
MFDLIKKLTGLTSNEAELDRQEKARQTGEMDALNERNVGRQIRDARPMVVVAGPSGPPRNGIAQRRAEEDPDLLAKVKPFLRKGETIMQWFARTGIGAHQLLTYTHRDLKHLVAVVEGNRAEDTGAIEPKRSSIPSKFRVTFDASGDLDGAYSKSRMPNNIVEVGI